MNGTPGVEKGNTMSQDISPTLKAGLRPSPLCSLNPSLQTQQDKEDNRTLQEPSPITITSTRFSSISAKILDVLITMLQSCKARVWLAGVKIAQPAGVPTFWDIARRSLLSPKKRFDCRMRAGMDGAGR
ncbi:hypothetical protein E4U09_007121 [Claviceps aff. purpurea]|uniref:Uncharacterized protein n=1 Tax=Claviceps aff. purpurea TaxID=1967640 RepID=A0A9P7U502_9HYPO|nr:hypothetical protein E4U09_007121 [Claviceps aff. purpurea]